MPGFRYLTSKSRLTKLGKGQTRVNHLRKLFKQPSSVQKACCLMHAFGHVVQASIAGLRCSRQRRNDKLRQLHYAITSVHEPQFTSLRFGAMLQWGSCSSTWELNLDCSSQLRCVSRP